MCGIIGVFSREPVNQRIYDALTVLQHRGQDAAGIATSDGRRLFLRKANGLVVVTRNEKDFDGAGVRTLNPFGAPGRR